MLWVFLAYLAVLLALGFVAERYTKGLEGFLLGDRKMGPWLTALSYEATAYSGWLIRGLAVLTRIEAARVFLQDSRYDWRIELPSGRVSSPTITRAAA